MVQDRDLKSKNQVPKAKAMNQHWQREAIQHSKEKAKRLLKLK